MTGHRRHQVYHATTTVGFDSQYMNEHSAKNVLEHILEWSKYDPVNGGEREGVSDACLGAGWAELKTTAQGAKTGSMRVSQA